MCISGLMVSELEFRSDDLGPFPGGGGYESNLEL